MNISDTDAADLSGLAEDNEEDEEFKRNTWIFQHMERPHIHRRPNEFTMICLKRCLCESLRRYLTRHDLPKIYDMMPLLAKDTTLDPNILIRTTFILLSSTDYQDSNKYVLFYLETLFSKLDVCKISLFTEFLSYLIKNDHLKEAKEMLTSRHRYINMEVLRPTPYSDLNLKCHELYLNYMDWCETDHGQKLGVSTQGWLANAMQYLKLVMTNHEFYLICVVRVLLHYGYNEKAYLIASEFQRSNPDNLTANLILLRIIERYSLDFEEAADDDVESRESNRSDALNRINNFDGPKRRDKLKKKNDTPSPMIPLCPDTYPLVIDKKSAVSNVKRLDPANAVLMDRNRKFGDIESLENLLDGLESISEISNIKRWKRLKKAINRILKSSDATLLREARDLWTTKYQRYWRDIDFVQLAKQRVPDVEIEVIQAVIDKIHDHLDSNVKSENFI